MIAIRARGLACDGHARHRALDGRDGGGRAHGGVPGGDDALLVYRKLGLAFLRTAQLILVWVWAGALVVTGVAVLLR